MNIDDLDTEILLFLLENPSKTTWDIARAVSPRKDPQSVSVMARVIRYRVQRLVRAKVVEKMPATKNVYRTGADKVFLGEGALIVPVKDLPSPFSLELGEFLIVTNGSGTVYFRSIEEAKLSVAEGQKASEKH